MAPEPRPVAVIMGSDSDLPVVEVALRTLEEFGIGYEARVLSAHRSPRLLHEYMKTVEERGFQVIIGAAGRAAHLAGVLAASTTLPVIAIPIESAPLQGLDALYSTLQMPSGVPVATMALGKAGARNAAVFAAQILSLSDPSLRRKLTEHRKRLEAEVAEQNQRLADRLEGNQS